MNSRNIALLPVPDTEEVLQLSGDEHGNSGWLGVRRLAFLFRNVGLQALVEKCGGLGGTDPPMRYFSCYTL